MSRTVNTTGGRLHEKSTPPMDSLGSKRTQRHNKNLGYQAPYDIATYLPREGRVFTRIALITSSRPERHLPRSETFLA